MKFSIIIPTYNRAKEIGHLLNSLIHQTFNDFEVIICDDGSTDATKEVVNTFNGKLKIKYLYLQNSGGPACPRNEGIRNSEGEYCAFLDSDDSWYVDKLKKVNDFVSQGYDWAYHDMDIVACKKITGIYKVRTFDTRQPQLELLYRFNPIATSGIVIKKSLLDSVGMFNEGRDYHFIEDFDYWLRLVTINTNVKVINESLGVYNDHDVNNSKNEEQLVRIEYLYDKYNSLIRSNRVSLAKYYIKFSIGYNKRDKLICESALKSMFTVSIFHRYNIKALLKYLKYRLIDNL